MKYLLSQSLIKQQTLAWSSWEDDIRSCTDCPLAQTRINAVCGNGNYAARIMLLGEAPGRQEDADGMPFVGAAGSLLDRFLSETGIDRESLYISNAVKCRPVRSAHNGKGYANRRPTRTELQSCNKYLKKEIDYLRPWLIVTLGAVALSCFVPESVPKMALYHGQPFYHHDLAIPIFPLYHPASVIYDQKKAHDYLSDLHKLKNFLFQLQLTGE